MTDKPTVILGATDKSHKYAYIAVQHLLKNNHTVYPIGRRPGKVEGLDIITDLPQLEKVHTLVLYLNKFNQQEYYSYILGLKPKRIIFPPGAENPELAKMAESEGIESVEGCTMVMLASNQF